jgi:hypothetical protein
MNDHISGSPPRGDAIVKAGLHQLHYSPSPDRYAFIRKKSNTNTVSPLHASQKLLPMYDAKYDNSTWLIRNGHQIHNRKDLQPQKARMLDEIDVGPVIAIGENNEGAKLESLRR